jgi:uncharacterized protein (TIGR03435 family)
MRSQTTALDYELNTLGFKTVNSVHMRGASLCILMTAVASAAQCQEFEVVSVKPNRSISNSSGFRTDQGRLMATNVSLRGLIVRGYGVPDYQVEGPDWLSSERFDVAATFPEALPKDRVKYDAAFHLMMQNMLADRFKLVVHREQKIRPVYGLVVGKSGPKFKQAPDSSCDSHSRSNNGTHFVGTCVSIDAFAEFLARRRDLPADLPVLDMTGLKGLYNLTLDWTPEPRQSAERTGDLPVVADIPSGPTLLVALQEQLGLELETRRAPIEILVVDHAEKAPSEN